MSDTALTISELSSKEEVANYLATHCKLRDEAKNILLDEFITGDILPILTSEDIDGLGIKLGPRKKIMKEISTIKDQFKEKEITEQITIKSKPEEVKDFFEKSLEFTGELNSLDGKGLLELDEEGMKALGLKFGQRKRLIRYIEYFKTLKPPPDEEEYISISRQSSEDEVSKFLKIRLKFSQDSIDNIQLDGESLFDLNEEEIDKIKDITTEEKENLKSFIRGELDKKEEEIKIDLNSSLEDICNFLKKKLNFSDEAIEGVKEQDLDGESFLALTEDDIKKIEGISELEREKLIIYLTEYKKEKEGSELKIVKESSKEDVAKFLKEKLNFSEKALKEWKLDGKSLLSLKNDEIDKLNKLTKEEKDNLKKFLTEEKGPIPLETEIKNEIKIEEHKVEKDNKDDKIKIKQKPEDSKKVKEKKEEKKKE